MAKRRQPTLAITQPHAKFLVSCRRLMSNALSQNFKKIAPSVQKLWPKIWHLALLYYRGGLFGLCLLDVLFGDILHVGNQGIWIFDNRIIGFQVTGGSHGEDPHCTNYNLYELVQFDDFKNFGLFWPAHVCCSLASLLYLSLGTQNLLIGW